MEYFPCGDLTNHVTEALAEGDARVISHQLAEALNFMHDKKFTHRDLKPSVRQHSIRVFDALTVSGRIFL